MPYRMNDRPNVYADKIGPGTTPTLKLARHGGGTIGGPVRMYTGNPFTFIHQGNEVTAFPTVLETHRYTQPEHAMIAELHPNQAYRLKEAPVKPTQPGGTWMRGGQFVMPDTSVGSSIVRNLLGGASYPTPAPKPVTNWERLMGAVGLRRKR